jgi:hypothetical protein
MLLHEAKALSYRLPGKGCIEVGRREVSIRLFEDGRRNLNPFVGAKAWVWAFGPDIQLSLH